VDEIGRRLWKKESGYHRQGRAENTFFRYKQISGPRLHASHPLAQAVEAKLACSILNRMAGRDRPESIRIGPWNLREVGEVYAILDSCTNAVLLGIHTIGVQIFCDK